MSSVRLNFACGTLAVIRFKKVVSQVDQKP